MNWLLFALLLIYLGTIAWFVVTPGLAQLKSMKGRIAAELLWLSFCIYLGAIFGTMIL